MPIDPHARNRSRDEAQQKPSEEKKDTLKPKGILDSLDETEQSGESKGKFKVSLKPPVIIGIIIILLVIVLLVFLATKEKKSDDPAQETPTATTSAADTGGGKGLIQIVEGGKGAPAGQQKPAVSTTVAPATSPTPRPSGVVPGMQDISGDTVKINEAPVVESFVKDLNSQPLPEKFEIASYTTVTDFVSYKKKRSVMADGVELYWLDAEYKGKPAIVQVSLKVFKELDEVGIIPVDVEIVQVKLEDGKKHELATNFVVRLDYKKQLNKK